MHIVFAASECVPFAKTGGLADVVGALAPEMAKLGHRVTVYLPLYERVRKLIDGELTYAARSITIPFSYYNRFAAIVDGGRREGVQYYFVECAKYFDRAELYGTKQGEYKDNAERFAFFSRAVLEASKQLGVPDVIHIHDWQTALVPVYLRALYADDPLLAHVAVVLTIHNAAYQGKFSSLTTEQLLFPWDVYRMDRLEHYGCFNFLKGGLVYSDLLTTVSRRYAREIQTPEFGEQLEGVLKRRARDLRGILNGVDYALWNPASDPLIAAPYTPKNLAGKQACRAALLKHFDLRHVGKNTPVIGIVSRFATQKGFDMVAEIADEIMARDLVVVALGSGEPLYERFFRNWAARSAGKVRVEVRYSEALAHQIEAGADMFLMPSRYEPCGLNQIYSLKYGTVPVVRATGGLDDTIEEWKATAKTGTGFKFEGYNPRDLLAALDRALDAYKNKAGWTTLMRNGMAKNYDWSGPAREYLQAYETAMARWKS